MGWALRTSSKGKRFSDVQKKYLVDLFDVGEQGEKLIQVMFQEKFDKGDFLTLQQIASFSQLAKKRRENTAGDKDNGESGHGDDNYYEEDDLNKKDFEKDKKLKNYQLH